MPDAAPRWAVRTLRLAAVYNLAWGLAIGLAPGPTLAWLGIPASENTAVARAIWACVGMIVGVYGLAYLAAARAPFRHWPVVAAGLLGKVLGPIGFVATASRGDLPWAMGWTILTNDLVWWIPFAAILFGAAAHAQRPAAEDAPVPPPDELLARLPAPGPRSLAALSHEAPLLLVLLRHAGCTFCREAIADLAAQRAAIDAAGARIALVHLGREDDLRPLLARHGLDDAIVVADPDAQLYRALELGRGSFAQLFGPVVAWRGLVAGLVRGHGVGVLSGDGFRMPGVFLLERGRVVRAFRHRHAAERPSYAALACAARAPDADRTAGPAPDPEPDPAARCAAS